MMMKIDIMSLLNVYLYLIMSGILLIKEKLLHSNKQFDSKPDPIPFSLHKLVNMIIIEIEQTRIYCVRVCMCVFSGIPHTFFFFLLF